MAKRLRAQGAEPAYQSAPPAPGEFSADVEGLGWDAEGWGMSVDPMVRPKGA